MTEYREITAMVAHFNGCGLYGRILITGEIPKFDETDPPWEDQARTFYDEQARKIIEVLVRTLPGGTLDRVLAQLLARSVSLHRIPWIKEGGTNG